MKILVAPLNWGLGHATRCIPIIRHYLEQGNEVILGGDGDSLRLLQRTFPALRSIDLPSLEIRYTTNGKYPTVHSPRYTAPLTVAKREDLRAITVVSGTQYSLPLYFAPDYSAYKAYGQHVFGWEPLRVQSKPSNWRFEVTGKVSGNGTYELTVIPTRGDNAVKLGNLKLWKRNELMAEVVADKVVKTGDQPATYRFTLDAFEAGTPFFIEIGGYAPEGNNTTGMMFLHKID
jgi:hexosaminidase